MNFPPLNPMVTNLTKNIPLTVCSVINNNSWFTSKLTMPCVCRTALSRATTAPQATEEQPLPCTVGMEARHPCTDLRHLFTKVSLPSIIYLLCKNFNGGFSFIF